MKSSTRPTYFTGLNGLRFIAAFLVLLAHLEDMKRLYGYEHDLNNPFMNNIAGSAVTFFFVLSGFLITYLLLEEKRNTNHICLKQFYLKRILRIWPLYYLIMLLGLLVLPFLTFLNVPQWTPNLLHQYSSVSWLYLMMLPNVVFSFFDHNAYLVQTWSIGVEEQFYLVWPLLLIYSRNYLRSFLSVVGIYIILKCLVIVLGSTYPEVTFIHPLRNLIVATRFGSMATGAIGAYLLFEGNKRIIQFLQKPVLQIFILCITLLWLALGIRIPLLTDDIQSVFFILLILAVSSGKLFWLSKLLENKVCNFLGKISYGLYMYHFIAIGISFSIYRFFFSTLPLEHGGNLLLFTLSTLLTIAISAASFYWFEQPIMHKRNQVSRLLDHLVVMARQKSSQLKMHR